MVTLSPANRVATNVPTGASQEPIIIGGVILMARRK